LRLNKEKGNEEREREGGGREREGEGKRSSEPTNGKKIKEANDCQCGSKREIARKHGKAV